MKELVGNFLTTLYVKKCPDTPYKLKGYTEILFRRYSYKEHDTSLLQISILMHLRYTKSLYTDILYPEQAHNYGGGPGVLDPCPFPHKDKVPFFWS